MEPFNTAAYISSQMESFRSRIYNYSDGPTYIEFGGKPFDDQHAARVLPGYQAHCKIDLLRELDLLAKIVMCVNARDIFHEPTGRYSQGRIRGDSGLRYADETIRLINKARTFGIHINDVVVSILPGKFQRGEDQELFSKYKEMLHSEGIALNQHYEIVGYPSPSILNDIESTFSKNHTLAEKNKNLVVFSPGGGSGKFSIILSELYHAIKRDELPNFVKFETFPVFRLDKNHPINLAYLAATADLQNETTLTTKGLTCYDKDHENFIILKTMFQQFEIENHPVSDWNDPTDMSANVIEKGFEDMDQLILSSKKEIDARLARYKRELEQGDEKETTVRRVEHLLERYEAYIRDQKN